MLQIRDNNSLSIQADQNKKNQGTFNATDDSAGGDKASKSIENLATATKSTKSKKLKLTKPKKSNFAFSGTNFLTSKAKNAFIHQQKAFTKALILKHFDPEYHIRIKTNALGYAISGMLSPLTFKTSLAGQVTYEPSSQPSL